jgi:hypothetical protein
MIPATGSHRILQESTGNHSKEIRKISGRNIASTKSAELLGTGRFRAGLFDLGTHVLQYIFKTIVNYSEKDHFIFFPYAV